ncbi:MAG: vanadium-dependent haloperoxidase [Runella sp.]
MISKKQIALLLVLGICLGACKKRHTLTPQEVVIAWADMTLYILKHTPSNSPTFASRSLGYIGLTMYESIVPGFPEYQSVASQLNGLSTLPQANRNENYNWVLSLNAAQASILKNIYQQTSDANKAKIDSLEQAIHRQLAGQITDKNIIPRSVRFGRLVAEQIFEWSKTDGGHRGYLKNFDKSLVYPQHLGCWKPPLYGQSFSHFPLHPHWGKNRTFVKENENVPIPLFIPFDSTRQSNYYKQFWEVYQKEQHLTKAEKEAAVWWGDDPDETPTPPGHSYYLATLAIKKNKPSLIKCAETYAKLGMALSDAFRYCWKWKYQFFSERPNTFITEHIDPLWESFWPDPPFPAFPSGHAIQAAAMATVLTDQFGEKFAFTDSLHVGRPKDRLRGTEFKARVFESFWEAAHETAQSRFYGGIHTSQDNQAGLLKGREIAENVLRLTWRKDNK